VSLRAGVDLGGTKIVAIVLDGTREVMRLRTDTPRDDYPGTVEAIGKLVDAFEGSGHRPATVGVGMPGSFASTTGLVKNANSTWLIGRPLLADLQARLVRPVRIANDANCFAISEASDGAAAGAPVVFGVIIGTGTGAGVVVHGEILTGPNGIAGEWGHNPLPWPEDDERPGAACYCGRAGCIETFLSGPGLARDHEERTGRRETAEQIAASASDGDRIATQTMSRYERRMARALASVVNVLDPDVIVLGGGVSNIQRLYVNVPRLWNGWVFGAAAQPEPVRTRLVQARHGDASGVRGAAWLWPDE
jgi:fructokinase